MFEVQVLQDAAREKMAAQLAGGAGIGSSAQAPDQTTPTDMTQGIHFLES